MKKVILIILTLGFVNYANGQDYLKNFEDYYSSIDTTNRPVFKFVEKMPEILDVVSIMKMIPQSQLFDSLQCCPIRVWIGLVVEPDSTLTNIQVYTKMMFCESNIIDMESKKFNHRMAELFSNVKSAPGELNEEKVAVAYMLSIHFECR